MNILLIGNGFDLEHGLPTSYMNFLDFCKVLDAIFAHREYRTMSPKTFTKKFTRNLLIIQEDKDLMLSLFLKNTGRPKEDICRNGDDRVAKGEKYLGEMYGLIENNCWYRFFRDCAQKTGKTWIDFESEISGVIQALDAAMGLLETGKILKREYMPEQGQFTLLDKIAKTADAKREDICQNSESIRQFVLRLQDDLDRFIRAFEIYISFFVNCIPVERKSRDIERIHIQGLLSFNYSNTYERIYGGMAPNLDGNYDYVHGKAEIRHDVNSCNMVLGIDEYLDDERKDRDLDFLSFKKYYQRIFKSTSNKYLGWVEYIRKTNEEYLEAKRYYDAQKTRNPLIKQPLLIDAPQKPEHRLYVFGHSLDVTDKDILRLLICNDNVQTKIFYYRAHENDRRTLGNLIKNLVRIIGQDELIKRTGEVHKTIEFIPQTLHE